MKNIKILVIFGCLFVLLVVGGFFGIKYAKNKGVKMAEYVPEEEITDEQSRQTIVSLYFENKETGEIYPEARLVDIKELMELPYEKLVNLLLEGPKNDKLKKIIPDNAKLLKTFMEGDCLFLDFSADILNIDNKEKLVNSISKTMTAFNEVNSVKILVEGKEEFKL